MRNRSLRMGEWSVLFGLRGFRCRFGVIKLPGRLARAFHVQLCTRKAVRAVELDMDAFGIGTHFKGRAKEAVPWPK